MPLPVEKLNKNSTPDDVRNAINDSYKVCMDEPAKEGESVKAHQKRCGGMIYSMAEEATGKKVPRRQG